MDSSLQALVYGVIQGLTEFLPVSSSGHLEIGKKIFGFKGEVEDSILLTVVLHFATALSTVVVFWKDLLEILKGILKFRWNEHWGFVLKIVVSMIPAALVGILLDEQIDALFSGNLVLVGAMLLVTGVLLFLADRASNTSKSVGWVHALIVGVAQAVAILPGISRSGATIATSVLLGIDRTKAARFSFLMVIPLIFGKIAKDFKDGEFADASLDVASLGIGFAAAFFTGLVACRWMIALVKRCQLWWFAVYCLIVGALVIGHSLMTEKDKEGPSTAPQTALVSPANQGLASPPSRL